MPSFCASLCDDDGDGGGGVCWAVVQKLCRKRVSSVAVSPAASCGLYKLLVYGTVCGLKLLVYAALS
jgi:hypothetical protein